MRRLAIVCLLFGCGRIAFDEVGDGGTGDSGGSAACRRNATVDDPLTITGTTFRYTSFDNSMRMAIASANITATDRTSGDPLALATSGAGGVYTLLVPTGGTPPSLDIGYSATGLFQSVLTIDRPIDRNVTGAGLPLWTIGDGPLWNATSMDAIYALVGATRDNAKGTVNVAVRDCAEQIIERAQVAFEPAPAAVAYQASDGTPSLTQNETVAPFAHVMAFNATAAALTITVTADGYTFQPITIAVYPAQANTLVVIHADP